MRKVTHRKFRFNKQYAATADYLLNIADEIWHQCQGLDTAVRDSIADGLARIVDAGYDCAAQNIQFADSTQWRAHISDSTALWFRDRGFAEWFCAAAADGFHHSRPRTLAESAVKVRRSGRRRVTIVSNPKGGKK